MSDEYNGSSRGAARGPYTGRRDKTPDAAVFNNGYGAGDRNRPFAIPATAGPSSIREQDYILPTADSKGATVGIRAKVTPAVERAIAAIIESGRFPFTCQADFIRAAVSRLLTDCAAMDGHAKTIMAVVNLQRETQAHYMIQAEMEELLEVEARICSTLLNQGEEWEARSRAIQLHSRLSNLTEDAHKRMALAKFKTLFSHLTAATSQTSTQPVAVNGGLPQTPSSQFSQPLQSPPGNQLVSTGSIDTNPALTPQDRSRLHQRVLMRFSD